MDTQMQAYNVHSFFAGAVISYVLSTVATRDNSFYVRVMSLFCIVPISV